MKLLWVPKNLRGECVQNEKSYFSREKSNGGKADRAVQGNTVRGESGRGESLPCTCSHPTGASVAAKGMHRG